MRAPVSMQPLIAPMIESRTASDTNVPPIGPIVSVATSAADPLARGDLRRSVITFRYARFAETYSTTTAAIPITSERSRFRSRIPHLAGHEAYIAPAVVRHQACRHRYAEMGEPRLAPARTRGRRGGRCG